MHPESYQLANSVIKKLNLTVDSIGSANFVEKVKSHMEENIAVDLAKVFAVPKERVCIHHHFLSQIDLI